MAATKATKVKVKSKPKSMAMPKRDKKTGRFLPRHLTPKDRAAFASNARKGTKKWAAESTAARKAARDRATHGWGFNGKSPMTKARKYKKKKKANYF